MTYTESLNAIADPRRRALLEALASKPMSVTELAKTQPVSRPAVSQHLKVLENAGLVHATPQGNRRIYTANRDGLLPLRDYIDSFWDDALNAFASHIQETEEKDL